MTLGAAPHAQQPSKAACVLLLCNFTNASPAPGLMLGCKGRTSSPSGAHSTPQCQTEATCRMDALCGVYAWAVFLPLAADSQALSLQDTTLAQPSRGTHGSSA